MAEHSADRNGAADQTAEASAEHVLAAALAAQAPLAEHRDWGEAHGRLHVNSVGALVAAGVPRLFLPPALGGLAADPVTCALVCETLADADPAAAWYVMVYNAARLMAARWPVETVEFLWGDHPDALVAASGHTLLSGTRTATGAVISGRTSFVSGCHHADFVMAPAQVDGELCFALIPAAQVQIVDNWDTLGMRGTGSNDVLIEGVEIPEVQLVVQAKADRLNGLTQDHALYRCPSRVVFATYVPVALSLARRALQALDQLAQAKVPYASDAKLRERTLAQQHYGRGLAKYRSVRLYFLDALAEVWARAQHGEVPTDVQRADLYLAGTHTLQTCAEIVRHTLDAAGSSVFYRGQPLEQILRDMETLKHHGFANESRYASVTQVLWGAELDYPLVLR